MAGTPATTVLGGTSLVQQWSRCLDFIQSETWVQILGDDDTLAPNAVASFYGDNYSTQRVEGHFNPLKFQNLLFPSLIQF